MPWTVSVAMHWYKPLSLRSGLLIYRFPRSAMIYLDPVVVLIEEFPFIQWIEREDEERKGGERKAAGGVHNNTTGRNIYEVWLVGLTRKGVSSPIGGRKERERGRERVLIIY